MILKHLACRATEAVVLALVGACMLTALFPFVPVIAILLTALL